MLIAGGTLLFHNLAHTWSKLIILFQQDYGCTYLVFCLLPFLLNFKALAKQLCRRERESLVVRWKWLVFPCYTFNYLDSTCHYCFK